MYKLCIVTMIGFICMNGAFGRLHYNILSYNSSADKQEYELCLIQLCTVPVCV